MSPAGRMKHLARRAVGPESRITVTHDEHDPMSLVTHRLQRAATSHGRDKPGGSRRLMAILCIFSGVSCFAPATLKAEAQPIAASSIEVAVKQGRLTVNLRDAPLDDVFQAVGKAAGIAIRLRGDPTAPVTNSFADIPLEEGIRKLLHGYSYTLATGDAEGSKSLEIAVIAASRVEPSGKAGEVSPPDDRRDKSQRMRELARRKDAAAIAELSGLAQDDPSPVVRRQAIAALGQLGGPETLAPLTRALADQASSVRVQALQGMKNLKGTAAIADLQAMAGSDPDPTVRKQAVRLLSEIQSPEVPSLLKQAEADNDAAVSAEAKQAAKRWEQRFGARSVAAGKAP